MTHLQPPKRSRNASGHFKPRKKINRGPENVFNAETQYLVPDIDVEADN